MEKLNGGEVRGMADKHRQAEIYTEGERQMRMSDCIVHLRERRMDRRYRHCTHEETSDMGKSQQSIDRNLR